MSTLARLFSLVLCAVLGCSSPRLAASADVDVRMQLRPPNQPIRAFVNVTDGGFPVSRLESFDFIAWFDGTPNNDFTFSQSSRFDPAQQISVVFAIDCTSGVQDTFAGPIEAGLAMFIDIMVNGDYAAIVKLNDTSGADVVQPFTEIDGGNGDNLLLTALADACGGVGTNLLDALDVAANELAATANVLPPGPKAIVLISDGNDDSSGLGLGEVLDTLNASGIAVFSVDIGDISGDIAASALMTSLAGKTGGRYFAASDEAEIKAASLAIFLDLDGSYVLSWPADTVTDCDEHTLEVVGIFNGVPNFGGAEFARCDSTPDDFDFVDETGVEPGELVVSNTVAITGIDVPIEVSVSGGEYSIGCGTSFTSEPGLIGVGDEVCVRHTADPGFQATAGPTVLVVGGVSSSFRSTTRAANPPPPPPPPPPRGGGGGATGLFELLLAISALIARRRLTMPTLK